MKKLLTIFILVAISFLVAGQPVKAKSNNLQWCLGQAESSRTSGFIFCGTYATGDELGICIAAVDNAYGSDIWNCYAENN